MNLRKLLCGLLALCLLLTMAPAALMEEAAVEEQVVELGGEEVASEAVEAEDYKAIDLAHSGELYLPSDLKVTSGTKKGYSGSTYLAVEDTLTIDVDDGFTLIDAKSQNTRVATVEAGEITGVRAGDALIKVTIQDSLGQNISCAVTVYVYDNEKPGAVLLYALDEDGYADENCPIKGATLTGDASETGIIGVAATVLPETVTETVYWSSDKSSVAAPRKKATAIDEDDGVYYNTIELKSKGTATITAKCGTAKATFKVKVTDDNAPTSISAKTDAKDNEFQVGKFLPVYSVVSPRPYADYRITWTLANTKYACFANEETGAALSGTTYSGSNTCLLYGRAEGTVKLTAKTYNGKKSTIKIKVTDGSKPTKIEMYGFYSKEKFEWELYDEEHTEEYKEKNELSDYSKPVKSEFIIVPVIYAGSELAVEDAVSQYANVKWSSSNKKVADIKLFKNYTGYLQDQDPDDLEDRFGNNVYDLMDEYYYYAAVVSVKATGTTTLTAKTKDGKKSFSVTLKVVNNHAADRIDLPFGSTVTVNVGDIIIPAEYVEVTPYDYYGKLEVAPTHSTSKIVKVDDGAYRADKKGTVTFKAKVGDKSKTFKIKIIE